MPDPNAPAIGFGMNVAYTPRSSRHLLDDDPERHDVVGHRQRVRVAEVDLVLARAELVVAVLDGMPIASSVRIVCLRRFDRHVHLGEVEVAGAVEGLGVRPVT